MAVVQPPYQVFSLPTSKAIIDASGSTDDAPKEELTFKYSDDSDDDDGADDHVFQQVGVGD